MRSDPNARCATHHLQIEAIEQVAQQAVTVVLRNMAPLRKLARGAASNQINRNAYGLHVRLAMRRSATAELIDASASLLADLAHLFSLIAGQQSAAGQRGRTSGRHIATLMKVRWLDRRAVHVADGLGQLLWLFSR